MNWFNTTGCNANDNSDPCRVIVDPYRKHLWVTYSCGQYGMQCCVLIGIDVFGVLGRLTWCYCPYFTGLLTEFSGIWSGATNGVNTSGSRQNGRRFADDVFKCIFLNENISILIKISLEFVPTGPITNIPSLVQIVAWRRPGDKPLSEPMMVSLPTQICISRPQWVK